MSDEDSPKIWLVSTGEYSEYGVVAVFDDDHKAEAVEFAKLVGGVVEVHPLSLNPTHQEPPGGQSFFEFQMGRDGTLPCRWGCREGIEQGDLLCDDGSLRKCHYRVSVSTDIEWRLVVRMYARDKEHAVKVANEIRIQILAGAKPTEGSIP